MIPGCRATDPAVLWACSSACRTVAAATRAAPPDSSARPHSVRVGVASGAGSAAGTASKSISPSSQSCIPGAANRSASQSRCSGIQGAAGSPIAMGLGRVPAKPERAISPAASRRSSRVIHQAACSTA